MPQQRLCTRVHAILRHINGLLLPLAIDRFALHAYKLFFFPNTYQAPISNTHLKFWQSIQIDHKTNQSKLPPDKYIWLGFYPLIFHRFYGWFQATRLGLKLSQCKRFGSTVVNMPCKIQSDCIISNPYITGSRDPLIRCFIV